MDIFTRYEWTAHSIEHVNWGVTLRRAKKVFFPDGRMISVREMQDTLKSLKGKIALSFDLLRTYGLVAKVTLGEQELEYFNPKKLGSYLWDNAINPAFFAEAVHLVASRSASLSSCIKTVRLLSLKREKLAEVFARGEISRSEIGSNFEGFPRLTTERKMEILVSLGVIILNPGTTLPIKTEPTPPPASTQEAKKPEPAFPSPPIRQLTPTTEKQLDFLALLK